MKSSWYSATDVLTLSNHMFFRCARVFCCCSSLPCTSPKGDAKTGHCTNLRRMMWQNINQCWPRNVIGGSKVWSFYKFPTGSCPKINCPKNHIANSFFTHHGSFLRGRGYHFHSCLHIGACGTIPNLSLCGTCHLGATVVRLAHGGLGGSNVKGFEFPIGINPPLIKTARTMGRKMRTFFSIQKPAS